MISSSVSNEERSLDGYLLRGDFNFPDIYEEYRSAVTNASGKFLQLVSQILSEPTRKDALLGLLFVNGEGLIGEVMVRGCLGHRDHKMVECKILV